MLWTSVALLLMILPALIKSGRGPYSLFSESLTGQVSLMAYLPSSLWVAQTKVQNGEKNVLTWTFLISTFSPFKAAAPASPFFPTEGDKMLSKKCHILMCAVMFSTNGHWMQYFTKNWARDCFIENTAPYHLAQTYDFIAEKRCLLLSIILKF